MCSGQLNKIHIYDYGYADYCIELSWNGGSETMEKSWLLTSTNFKLKQVSSNIFETMNLNKL